MTEVQARLAPGRELGPDDFRDLGDVEGVDWAPNGDLRVTLAASASPAVAGAVRRRIVSRDEREETVRAEAETYLDDPEPDLSEIRAQVARLSELVLGER